MAQRKLRLVLVSFWIWQMTQESTASQDWITLRGCYDYTNDTGSIIPFNEPQACFDRCPNSTEVGMKDSTCICLKSYSYSGLRRDNLCNIMCPGNTALYCGAESGSNGLINVYSKGPPPKNDINENTDYGFVSVSFSPSGETYHAYNNNSTSRNGYICYDDIQFSDPCHRFEKEPDYTWENAIESCHRIGQVLIAFSKIPRCVRRTLIGGIYWIGLYRNIPGSATPSMTTSTLSASISTKPTRSTFTSIITRVTTTKRAIVSNLYHDWTSSVPETDTTSKGSSDDGIKTVYVAVPVVAVILAVAAFALISWKIKILCFKPRHNSVETEVLENPILAKNDLHQTTEDIINGKPKSDVDFKNVQPQVDAEQDGYRIIDGIQPGMFQKVEIEDEFRKTVKESVDDRTGGKRKKGKGRHGKKKKNKHKKHSQIDAPGHATKQTENSCEDNNIDVDVNNKHLFGNTSTIPLYSQAEKIEIQGESKSKHEKRNRKDKKRSYDEDLVEKPEGAQYNVRDDVRNSDIYTGNHLGAARMNVLLPQAENENKLEDEDDRRTHKRKKSRRKKRTSQEENYFDDKTLN